MELLSVLVVLHVIHLSYGEMYCLTCLAVVSPRHCKSIRRCDEGQVCYTEQYRSITGETLYNVGCQTTSRCSTKQAHPLKQRLLGSKRYVYNVDTTTCVECCSTDGCNRNGCGSPDYPEIRGPVCFDCQQTLDPGLCRSVSVCREDEVCQTYMKSEFGDKIFTLACAPNFVCDPLHAQTSTERCNQCCKTDLCNKDSCESYRGPYGFQAKAERDQGPGVLIFKNITTNVGAGYDHNTGYFTAKRNGLYVFTWSVQSYEESIMSVLKVNGQEKGYAKTLYRVFASDTASSFAVLRLVLGDNVNIELVNGTARKTNTIFTGWSQYSTDLETIPAFYTQCPANCSYLTNPTTNNGGAIDVQNDALVLQDGFYIGFNQFDGRRTSVIPSILLDSVWSNDTDSAFNANGGIQLSTSALHPCEMHIGYYLEWKFTTLPSAIPFVYKTNCSGITPQYYPNTTVVFTAPLNGIYGFAVRIATTHHNTMVALVVNSLEMVQIKLDGDYSPGPSWDLENAIASPTLELKRDDEVFVFLLNGNFTKVSVAGWLISELN